MVTDEILGHIEGDMQTLAGGTASLFLCHTSASLTLNENCDVDVRRDMETVLGRLVPDATGSAARDYRHTDEGPDDMPAHVKSSLLGVSLSIPIVNGKFVLGYVSFLISILQLTFTNKYVISTWQGIWLGEHRNRGGARQILVTLMGIERA